MSERIEKMLRDYPENKRELNCLREQIEHFHGISETDMIYSMQFSQPTGERVQTSNISDKTAQIAMNYRERMEKINREWREHLTKQYMDLEEEIRFLESAIKSLSGILPDFMTDMVMGGKTWDELCDIYHVSRTMVSKYRKKAIAELDVLYEKQTAAMIDYMLS